MVESIDPDLIKALWCLSSKNDVGMCYIEQYNQEHKDEQIKMYCWNAEEEGILCPFYRTKYDVIDNKSYWLNEIAEGFNRTKSIIYAHMNKLEKESIIIRKYNYSSQYRLINMDFICKQEIKN